MQKTGREISEKISAEVLHAVLFTTEMYSINALIVLLFTPYPLAAYLVLDGR